MSRLKKPLKRRLLAVLKFHSQRHGSGNESEIRTTGYYIGACNTGAGAALSIAIAVIGYNKSCTIAKPGIKAKDEHIAKMIAEGKVAFGLSVEHVEHAIPMLINHLK